MEFQLFMNVQFSFLDQILCSLKLQLLMMGHMLLPVGHLMLAQVVER